MSRPIVITRHTWPRVVDVVHRQARAWHREQRRLVQAAFDKHVAATHAKELEHVRSCADCQAAIRKDIAAGVDVPEDVRAILKGAPN